MALPSWQPKPAPWPLDDPRIDRAPALARGALIVPFWERGGTRLRSSWPSIRPLGGGSGGSWGAGDFGTHFAFASDRRFQYAGSGLLSNRKQWTVAVVYRTTSSAGQCLWCEGTPGAGSGQGFLMIDLNNAAAGNIRYFNRADDDSSAIHEEAVSGNDGAWHIALTRRRFAQLSGGAGYGFSSWFDGLQKGPEDNGTMGSSAITTDTATIGRAITAGTDTLQFLGDIALVVVWPRRALSDGEIRGLSQNPFAVLTPPPRAVAGLATVAPAPSPLFFARTGQRR